MNDNPAERFFRLCKDVEDMSSKMSSWAKEAEEIYQSIKRLEDFLDYCQDEIEDKNENANIDYILSTAQKAIRTMGVKMWCLMHGIETCEEIKGKCEK